MKNLVFAFLALFLFSCGSKMTENPFDQMENLVNASFMYEQNTGDDFVTLIVKYNFKLEGANPAVNSMDYYKEISNEDLRKIKIFHVNSDIALDNSFSQKERDIPKSLIFVFSYDGAEKARQGLKELKEFFSEKYPQAKVLTDQTETDTDSGTDITKYSIQKGNRQINVCAYENNIEITYEKV